ncbi:MAG: hypothetical protein FGM33_03405 [Candidatus Kapabacteria bacterium]|nr:hypothetical protein [Candidatus Kapabacteria bacterium]
MMSRLLAFAIILLSCLAPLQAQMQIRPGGRQIILGRDTICYRYRFAAADTLLYRIESRDSIMVPSFDVVEKWRYEGLRIVCDSVVSDLYHLTMRLEAFRERQRSGKDSSERRSHPWMQRVVRLVIDSLGRRIQASIDDSSRAMAAPGGLFQALRLPILDTACGRQQQSWISSDTIFVPENGIPAPEIRQQVFWRVGDHFDTLGRKASWIQYTSTAFGGVDVPDSRLNVTSVGSVAEYCRLVIDRGLGIPLSSFIIQQVRFKIQSGQSRSTTGRHHTTSTMSLVEIRSPDASRRWRSESFNAAPSKSPAQNAKPRRKKSR